MNASLFERQIFIRPFDVGWDGKMKLVSLLDYFQEAASEHAEKLGASITQLSAKNLTWVISRYHIRISRYPSWREAVKLTTWPSARQNLFALREFEITSEKGETLAAATSSWMVIDLRTKKPVRPDEHLPDYPLLRRRAVADKFKLLPKVERSDIERSFPVLMRDLDWNKHVNHVVYVEWAVETVPPDILRTLRPMEMEIDFRGEAFYGETVLCRTEILNSGENPSFRHQILRDGDERELARLKTFWQK